MATQMSEDRFARQRLIPGWRQASIQSARVLVIGAGTTGNEVVKNLALLGFGHITIIDLDRIEDVNLSRSVLFRPNDVGGFKAAVAARAARELNPGTEAIGLVANVITGYGNLNYREFACVVLTVDNLEARMWVNRYCWLCETPLVDTGVAGLNGNVATFFPPETGCLECSWNQTHYENIFHKFSCLKIGIDLAEPKIPMVISTASVIGGLAAQEVVRAVTESTDRTSRFIKFSGEARAWMTVTIPKSPACAGHTSIDIPEAWREVRDVNLDTPVASFVDQLRVESGCEVVQIQADKELVDHVSCRVCSTVAGTSPVWLTEFRRTSCLECGGPVTPFEPYVSLRHTGTFREQGIPGNHLLTVLYGSDDEITKIWIRLV